jgi:high-affinity nickel-transport protein
MFVVGLLFGLGFDTATEVGILAVSARSAQLNIPFWTLMLLPLLFTAGMCLIDTIDGIFMLGAYGWSYIKPARKLYYNVAITALSVVLALGVGSVELLQTAVQTFRVGGPARSFIDNLGIADLGFWIVAAFALTWAMAAAISRRKGHGDASRSIKA